MRKYGPLCTYFFKNSCIVSLSSHYGQSFLEKMKTKYIIKKLFDKLCWNNSWNSIISICSMSSIYIGPKLRNDLYWKELLNMHFYNLRAKIFLLLCNDDSLVKFKLLYFYLFIIMFIICLLSLKIHTCIYNVCKYIAWYSSCLILQIKMNIRKEVSRCETWKKHSINT